ncbi:ATP-binding protein [candidate division KSB1 bacterium]|nr:ATP-binding protein [candidate division KSB1 bacterium]
MQEEKFIHFQHDPDNPLSLSQNWVTTLLVDRRGDLWVGTLEAGLNRLNHDQATFTHFKHDIADTSSLSHNYVTIIFEDVLGELWIGTEGGGLSHWQRQTGKFRNYQHRPSDPNSLSDNRVYVIYEMPGDSAHHLWVSTAAGLNQFDRRTKRFRRFTREHGLPSDFVIGIQSDNHENLWLTTNEGLARFNPHLARNPMDKIFKLSELGLDRIEPGAFFKNHNGEFLVGGRYGYVRFHPDSIKENRHVPPIVLTNFIVANQEYALDSSLAVKKNILLTYDQNFFSIEFAALDFTAPAKNQYAYMFEGFNRDWIYSGNRRLADFTNVPPGTYTFRVKGSNNDGMWNEEGTSLRITITPPWWRTRWAYAFYIIVFTILLYGWRRFELNRVKIRNELRMQKLEAQKLQEIDEMKSRFFANISHEFRTPLTLILGPVEQIRAGEFKGNVQEAYGMILRNGRRLLRLINQLLDLAKLEAGRMSLQARPENIISFLKGLALSFASAAERKRITLTFSSLEEKLIAYIDRDKLEKIVSNLLSNALKFTPEGGSVTVAVGSGSRTQVLPTATATASANFIEISVTDTGSGIPAKLLDKIFDRFYQVDASHTREHEGTGIGLALTKELVELHHGEILVQSEVGRGTTFNVRLPLGKTHLQPEEVVETVTSDQFSVSSEQFTSLENRALNIEDQASNIQQPATSKEQQADETIVLVVEDNRDVRTYIRQYLEPTFKVIEAVDGIDGVQKALEIIPDLIISDVMMPKRDGNELCRILKTDEKTSHVPIIMLTAKADSESKVYGLEIGADDYLIKPFDDKELLARVQNLIKLRRQLRERFSREMVLKPSAIAITPMDETFLQRVQSAVEKHLDEEEFSVEILAAEVGMSRAQLHRKLRALIDQSANQLIRSMRLQRAVELLRQNAGTIAEVAYMVGFGSQAYFTKCFHEQFGCSPKEYVKNNFKCKNKNIAIIC